MSYIRYSKPMKKIYDANYHTQMTSLKDAL
jgi:hypothetical protein